MLARMLLLGLIFFSGCHTVAFVRYESGPATAGIEMEIVK